ncbi:MAG: NAD(P)/FAD-dependent oxidoreductase [Rhodocyclaceae bacterium]|jgi:L-2-hydroxyglutarate oxidase LhgO|nr:NAD(P)/FAD-dependent oxidoreductase [Rhodocyclaceae bacterium]
MERVDTVVVGAGVIGLAIARGLARAGRQVWLLEAGATYGRGISSRSSEVIHAGLYYPTGSLKARLCRRGRDLLYAYCTARNIPHRRTGKLLVANGPAEEARLAALVQQGAANGVDDLRLLSGPEARALEPELRCTRALLSPSTGILDSHALMTALLAEAEAAGARLVPRSRVVGGTCQPAGVALEVESGGETLTLTAEWVINAAGLGAPALAGRLAGFPAEMVPRAWLARGHYFSLAGPSPFRHLIYPVPEEAGLGIHLTLDLAGQARFGPDVEWITEEDYRVDPALAPRFAAAVGRYWPGLPPGALQPAHAGIRPKLHGPGEAPLDFRIDGPSLHGQAGLVNLFGLESPGLTACLAVAEAVVARVSGRDGPAPAHV